jgi:hypothetical protein
MGPVWISITTAIGAFAVALLCIYVSYQLFLINAAGAFKVTAQAGAGTLWLESAAPGIFFGAFGTGLAAFSVWRLIGRH